MGVLALIGLGSNLGDRKAHLELAVAALSRTPGVAVRAVSSYRETHPVGGPGGQASFLNAAAALETTLDPLDLLRALQDVEKEAGRVRTVRWGERTLDLDLLLFGDRVIDTADLHVPHPRMVVRRFVLAPAAEVAPEAVEPVTKRTIQDLLAHLDRRPSYLALCRWWADPDRAPVFQEIVRELGAVGVTARDAGRPAERFPLGIGPDPDSALARLVSELRVDRWSGLGERWIVSDFAFREVAHDAVHEWIASDTTRLESFLDQIGQERRILAPTFVVYGESGADRPRPGGFVCAGLPAILLESRDPEGIVTEALAACAATRAGLDPG